MPTQIGGFPIRLFAYVALAVSLAVPAVLVALVELALKPPSAAEGAGIALFLMLALAADFHPVPLDEEGNEVSLAFVFIVAVLLIFGWHVAVPIAAVSVLAPELARGRPPLRAAFNSAVYTLAALAALVPRLALGFLPGDAAERVTAAAFLCGAVYVVINVALVAGAASLAQGVAYRRVFSENLRYGGAAFGIMAFFAALAANLWHLKPLLLVLLAGPLFTVTLYQRSVLRSRIALRDANTDNLTGLGNHRAYQAALRTSVEEARKTGAPLSLCLLDIDDFKRLNDGYGHGLGDEVLVRIAGLLKQAEGTQAFRFGGDEFAVLVPVGDAVACSRFERVQRELAGAELSPDGPVTISVGIASFPAHGRDAEALQEVADGALYWSKRHGKNRACIYSPGIVRVHSTTDLEREAERAARLRAATNLVRFLDAKDASTANHSEIVATLAAAIGEQLDLDADTIAQLRLAGLLHDLGKIGIPERILQAPRGLTGDEFAIVRRHPEIGHSLLEGIDLAPVDDWILQHHERWDGLGYPNGRVGAEIPLGARIIHAADAFEAMTAGRTYRGARSTEDALAELQDQAGAQFDPDVVAAFERYLARVDERLLLSA
ncbi:MAG TPA: diguanylate cyclase [Gaiellaceae bacterium]